MQLLRKAAVKKNSHVVLRATWLAPRRSASLLFKSGQAIPALTQAAKGAGGGASLAHLDARALLLIPASNLKTKA